MASRYQRLLDVRKLTASLVCPREQVLDLGAYKTLEVDCRVPSVGTAGTIKIQHAAVNEEDAFRDLLTFNLSGVPAGGFQSAGNFLRWVRWVTDANVAGNPQAIIDVVAKE